MLEVCQLLQARRSLCYLRTARNNVLCSRVPYKKVFFQRWLKWQKWQQSFPPPPPPSSFGLVKSTEIGSLDNDLLYLWSDFSFEARYSSSCHPVTFLAADGIQLYSYQALLSCCGGGDGVGGEGEIIIKPNGRLYCINCYIKCFLIAFQAPWHEYMEYWPFPICCSAFPCKYVNSLS